MDEYFRLEIVYAKAVKAAVSNSKYLLKSLFDLDDLPKDTALTADDLTIEVRKLRKLDT